MKARQLYAHFDVGDSYRRGRRDYNQKNCRDRYKNRCGAWCRTFIIAV